MRRRITLVLLAAMFLGMFIVPAAAANNQGLDWAVSSTDRFDYNLRYDETEGENFTDGFYTVVDSLPTIPDDIDNWTEIPWVPLSAYWDNDTTMGFWFLALAGARNLVIPIGNWPLLDSLVDTQPDLMNVTVVHSSDFYWGYTYQTEIGSDQVWKVEVDFNKDTGVMALYNLEVWNTTSNTLDVFLIAYLEDMPADSSLEVTNQGLDWSVVPTDRFEYNMTVSDEGSTQNLEFYIDVLDSVPIIPQSVYRWDQLLHPEIEANWANDTSIGLWILVLLPAGNLFLPTGNWSLFTAMVESREAIYDVHVTDDSYYWGYTFKTAALELSESADLQVKYLKSDGALAWYKVEITNTTSSTVVSRIEVLRKGLPAPPTGGGFTLPAWITDNLLLIGIGAVVVVIGAVVCIKKR